MYVQEQEGIAAMVFMFVLTPCKGNRVGDVGCTELARIIQINTSLTTLELYVRADVGADVGGYIRTHLYRETT